MALITAGDKTLERPTSVRGRLRRMATGSALLRAA